MFLLTSFNHSFSTTKTHENYRQIRSPNRLRDLRAVLAQALLAVPCALLQLAAVGFHLRIDLWGNWNHG